MVRHRKELEGLVPCRGSQDGRRQEGCRDKCGMQRSAEEATGGASHARKEGNWRQAPFAGRGDETLIVLLECGKIFIDRCDLPCRVCS